MKPRVTVLMPVYNAAPYVAKAVRSILSGGFQDLVLLAIDDGSADRSHEILTSFADRRMQVVQNPENLGLVETLNRGLDMAEGEFVVRMDADDISTPDRVARQVAFMDANPEIGLSGTWRRTFGHGRRRLITAPESPERVRVELFGYNVIGHPTVILRRDLLSSFSLRFSPEARHAEDLDLWMRAADHFPISNLPVVTLHYRVHPNQITSRFSTEERETLGRLRKRQLLKLTANASERESTLHVQILDVDRAVTSDELQESERWLEKLDATNRTAGRYDPDEFCRFLSQRWLNLAYRCIPGGVHVWKRWRRSRFSEGADIFARVRLFVKKSVGR